MATDKAPNPRLKAAILTQWALTVGTLVAIGWIIWAHREAFGRVMTIGSGTFALMSASVVASFLVNGIEMRVLIRKFGPVIPMRDTTLLGLMVSTLNYLPMKTGTLLLGVVMRTRYKVRLGDFAALIAGSTVVYLWVSCTFAGFFRMLAGYLDLFSWALLVLPSLGVIGLVLWGRSRRVERDRAHLPRVARTAMRALDGLGLMFIDPVLLAKDLAINIVLLALASFETKVALAALSSPVGWGKAVAITGIANFVARLSIVPGGLGFREGAAAAGAVAVGVSGALGLGAATIDRAVNLVWLVILGVPATLYVERVTGLHVRMSLSEQTVTGEGVDEAEVDEARDAAEVVAVDVEEPGPGLGSGAR